MSQNPLRLADLCGCSLAGTCPVCVLARTDPAYAALWGEPPPVRQSAPRSLPCVHEEAVREWCTSTAGEVAEGRHVRGCERHERCSRLPRHPGLRACSECGDYDPGRPAVVVRTGEAGNGLGDMVSSLYAACGLADAGHSVTLALKHAAGWLSGVSHPGLSFARHDGRGVEADADYDGQLDAAAGGTCPTRPDWYCRQLARQLALPPFAPARPRAVGKPPAVREPGYAVLAPFSHGRNREWPGFRALAAELAGGRPVVVLDGPGDGARARELAGGVPGGVQYFWGQSPEWVAGLIAHADVFAGNDSGLAHVAGLYGTPAAAVMTHLPAEFVFGGTAPSVRGVPADGWACQGCGWRRPCPTAHTGRCGALDGIPPERVLLALGGPGAVAAAAGRSLVSPDRLRVIRDLVRATDHLPGDLAELGVFRGGTARLIGRTAGPGALHLFDTFAGIPESDEAVGGHAKGDFPADLDDVRSFLADPRAVYHVGRFPDTAPADPELRFRFVHFDGDTEQSARAAVEWFGPRMLPGGAMAFDDFGWPGCPGVERVVRAAFPPERIETPAKHQAVVRF